jgi:hypothetical protein
MWGTAKAGESNTIELLLILADNQMGYKLGGGRSAQPYNWRRKKTCRYHATFYWARVIAFRTSASGASSRNLTRVSTTSTPSCRQSSAKSGANGLSFILS